MLIGVQKKFVFVANPKTASSAIEAMLAPYAEIKLLGAPNERHVGWVKARETYAFLFDQKAYIPESFFRFGVVREPADWFRSWYNYRIGNRRLPNALPLDMTIEDYWRSDSLIKRVHDEHRSNGHDNIQRHRFVDADGICRFNLVIPYEKIATAMPVVFDYLGISFELLTKKNVSRSKLSMADMPPNLIQEINEFYAEDYQFYQASCAEFDALLAGLASRKAYLSGCTAARPVKSGLAAVKAGLSAKQRFAVLAGQACPHVKNLKIDNIESAAFALVSFTGTLVLSVKNAQGLGAWRLMAEDAHGRYTVQWGLPVFAANRAQVHTHFRVMALAVLSGQPARLLLVSPQGDTWEIAQIAHASEQAKLAAPITPEAAQNPFILWTCRQAGGLNFGNALFGRSRFAAVQNMPFNVGHVFGEITQAWQRHPGEMSAALDEITSSQVLIQHCPEIIHATLNQALADSATRSGYRHLFLYHRRPHERLLGLYFAQQTWRLGRSKKGNLDDDFFRTAIPIDKWIATEQESRQAARAIYGYLKQSGAQPLAVAYEDLFANQDADIPPLLLTHILQKLGLSHGEQSDKQFIRRLLGREVKDMRDVYKRFDNYDKFVVALDELGDFNLWDSVGKLAVMQTSDHAGPAQEVTLWKPVEDVVENRYILSGVVVLTAPQPDAKILVEHDGVTLADWGLPSPKFALRYPANPQAARARFRAADIAITPERPAELFLETAAGRTALGSIRPVAAHGE